MANFSRICEYLTHKGVFARYEARNMCFWFGIERPPDSKGLDYVIVKRFGRDVVKRLADEKRNLVLEDECHLRCEGELWVFRNSIPSIGFERLDSIVFESNRLRDAYGAVCRYYLRPPIKIKEWTVPIFQHPTWNLNAAKSCIANAIVVPFAVAEERRRTGSETAKLFGLPHRWENKSNSFLRILGDSAPLRYLYLKYDLSEALVATDVLVDKHS
jgi:hypothetical protein